MSPAQQPVKTWWKESSVYQVYPASFKDSTGNGVGDLKGITSKADYLKELGVDIVWLSPIFKSPQIDMGYDISDYMTIHPPYGDVGDVVTLKDELHKRGMKLVLDFVMNHTSDQHEWFKESRKSKDNPYRDWYIWKAPHYDAEGKRQPPNNWTSHFQGSAWEYDEATDEYYLRLFCKEQPDLNWENPAVVKACHDVMRFWLDKGIDGFRLDVINFISKDQRFPDSNRSVLAGAEYYACGPRLHEYLQGLGAILKEYDAFSVGEMPLVSDKKELIKAIGSDRGELSMIFHFEFVDVDHGPKGKFSPRTWKLSELRTKVEKWQRFMIDNDGWNALYLENHDQPRAISRFAHDDPAHRQDSAKMLAIFIALQSGTPFIYEGQEIGMTNVPKDWPIEEYQDVDCLNHWNRYKDTVDEATKKQYLVEYQKKSRDNARTPMQWDDTPHAGFTSGPKPWMRVNDNYKEINAASQTSDPNSIYHLFRQVLETRKQHLDIFVYGDFKLVDDASEDVIAFERLSSNGETALVIANFSTKDVEFNMGVRKAKKVLVSSKGRSLDDVKEEKWKLAPCEGIALLI